MKYYIPTSSLNLDNILQAECISPQSFYAQRKTGYESIELIDEVKKYDQIVLFNHPISFSIDDPGRYNYPLLIEIEDDTQLRNVYNVENSEMYLCGHTIYLTPQNCRFYFFSEKAYNITTINTKDNKSIKYYEKYNINPSNSSLKLIPLKIETVTAGAVCQSNEIAIDKQKGVCYAFLKGQLLSITPELAHQIRLTQDLYNILTGLISNPQKKDNFLDKLESLLKEYKRIDPIELNNKEKIEAKLDEDLGIFKKFKHLLQILLKKWDVWNYVYETLSHKWGFNMLPNVEELSSSQDFIELRNKIEERTCENLKEYQKKQALPSLGAISINNNVVEIKDMPIVNQTVNYIIRNQLTISSLSADRQGVCRGLIKDVVIEEIKKVKGEKYWDSSMEKKYFNTLYAHVGDLGKPFDLKEVDDPGLIAIAAFLLRGHDINALMTYLKSNEVCDYRNALVLWGALCGYMEMNKEFLSDTLTLDNYKNVYECLFQHPMGKLEQVSNEKISKRDEDASIEEVIALPEEKVNNIRSDRDLSLLDGLFEECPGIKNKKKIYKKHYIKYGLTPEFQKAVEEDNTLQGNKGKIPQNVSKWITKSLQEETSKRNRKETKKYKNEMTDMFNHQYTSLNEKTTSQNNLKSRYSLPKLNSLSRLSDTATKRICENWNYTAKGKPYMSNEHIAYFVNLCKKEGRGESERKELYKIFTEELAVAVKKELISLQQI